MSEGFRRMVIPVSLFNFFIFIFLFADHVVPLSSASVECPSFFDCGNLGRLRFPLTTPDRKDCGMLPIHGCEDHNVNKTVQFGKRIFQVTRIGKILSNIAVFIRDADLQKRLVNDNCDAFSCNITLPRGSALGSMYIFPNINFYKCNIRTKVTPPKQFLNYTGCGKNKNETIFFQTQDQDDPPPSLAACPRVELPVNMMAFSADPFTFIASEIPVNIQLSDDCSSCASNKGLCLLNSTGGF